MPKVRTMRWIIIGLITVALATVACGGGTVAGPAQPSPVATIETKSDITPSPVVGGQPGNRAPDFTLTLADGSETTLTSILAAGKPVMVYFFATW